MNKGSPGGILLIAFGVLFIRLAYTGRIGAVWQALMTGGENGDGRQPQTPETDPTRQGKPGTRGDWKCEGKTYPIPMWGCDGEKQCVDELQPNIVCKGSGTGVEYMTYNAAGAPYMTSAGNIV